MHIASIGIDLGKTTFHLVALGRAQQDSALQEIHALAVAGLHRQPAGGVNRTGGMRGIALCGYSAARAGAPGATDHGAVCQALPEVEQERLHRWEAIAEAVTKQNMRFVQIKTQEQLDCQAMHRVRDRLVQRRTALINETRGFLLERGITFPAQPIHLRKNCPQSWKMPSRT
jgi:transposase